MSFAKHVLVVLLVGVGGLTAQRHVYTFFGERSGDELGVGVAGIGDVDGDGCGDLLLGAPKHDGPKVDAGLARVVSGTDGRVIRILRGANTGYWLGQYVGSAGDVDRDGRPDYWVSEPRFHPATSLCGSSMSFR